MALTQDEVRRVARLARLELLDEELALQARHLNDLLARFGELDAVDVSGIEPTSHSIPMANVLREDRVRPSLDRQDVLANAPEAQDGCFVVPRIIED